MGKLCKLPFIVVIAPEKLHSELVMWSRRFQICRYLAPLLTGHAIQRWHSAKNRFTMGMFCKLPFIVIRHRSPTKVT